MNMNYFFYYKVFVLCCPNMFIKTVDFLQKEKISLIFFLKCFKLINDCVWHHVTYDVTNIKGPDLVFELQLALLTGRRIIRSRDKKNRHVVSDKLQQKAAVHHNGSQLA